MAKMSVYPYTGSPPPIVAGDRVLGGVALGVPYWSAGNVAAPDDWRVEVQPNPRPDGYQPGPYCPLVADAVRGWSRR